MVTPISARSYWGIAVLAAALLLLGASTRDRASAIPEASADEVTIGTALDEATAATALDRTTREPAHEAQTTAEPSTTPSNTTPPSTTPSNTAPSNTAPSSAADSSTAPNTTATRDGNAPTVSSDDDRRRYRRRYRNRYPGPIPTPADWEPPEGPVRIALQAGHWRAAEAPSELSGLRDNGTRWEDVSEWQANLEIARRAGAMLESLGYEVDILPAVVPPGYRAHLFISIHADGSGDPRASGYRVASPRRDATGRADAMATLLQQRYGESTGLRHLTSATRRMRNYYAFNFRRYEHALHPMTIAVILETGFLTSARDRTVILDDPDRSAAGIVEAVRSFPVTAQPVVAAEPQGPEDSQK